MRTLFGLPIGSVLVVLVAALGLALGAIAVLAARNRVFFRLGIRNARRRPARTALIVAGSMLGTAIIAAALATGDTMSHTIRSAAISALGRTDVVVAARGTDAPLAAQATDTAVATRYFSQTSAARIARAAAGSGLVDGVAPVIVEPIAVQDVTTRQNEPRVTLFAGDSRALRAFGPIRSGGQTVSLADLRPGEVYLNADAASSLGARAGDSLRMLVGSTVASARVRAVVEYRGSGSADDGLLMPLAAAQQLLGKAGEVNLVFVANHGGAGSTGEVLALLRPTLAKLGLEGDNSKQDALELADEQGAAFMSIFTTFGSFSIAAGILLIFLIFVMLAAERRSELGIARAVGTRRSHLVQMFLYEGLAYDLAAAAVGALLGIAVAFAMVFALAAAFDAVADVTIAFSVTLTSMVIAYAIGVLLTLAVVAFSAWRVSRMNIVSAIRNLADPATGARRSRWILGCVSVALGSLLVYSGVASKNAITLGFGVLLVILGLVPIARAVGANDRLVYTSAGLTLVVWFVLPINRWLLGELKTDFSMFILGGLAIVVGACWTLMYNADLISRGVTAVFGRNRRLAPVLKLSLAYPLASRFRTGVTLAMFTLVVFTLVTGAITTGSFVSGFNNMDSFGGGFDIRATTAPASPIRDARAALATAPGIRPSDIRVVSSQSVLPLKAHQSGTPGDAESYPVHGADAAFLEHTTYTFAAMAQGYTSAPAVWAALREHPNLAVVDALVVPRKQNYNFGAASDFSLSGFYLEDKTFAPIPVDVRDPQTGRSTRLTVIGVLSDRAPLTMAGLWTSQSTLAAAFGDRAVPTVHLFALAPGVDSVRTAKALESAFLANGMQADALKQVLADAVSASLTFDRLIEGFMGLGLIVGVAALGVVSARSVVERRQQIGVLRSIGFRRGMVQACFLLESSFVALTAIVIGTALGLAVGYNVIADTRRQPSWSGMPFTVPWLTLALIFVAVYGVAMLTTLLPARRASRVYPAEALHYQ